MLWRSLAPVNRRPPHRRPRARAAGPAARRAAGTAADLRRTGELSVRLDLRRADAQHRHRRAIVTRGRVARLQGGAAGQKPTPAEQQQIQEYVHSAMLAAAAQNKTAAKEFLATNEAKRRRDHGLGAQVQDFEGGRHKGAPRSAPTDEVTVDYRGKLLDGTRIRQLLVARQARDFSRSSGVIKGWQEALVMMKPGAKWQLYIPPELAYGRESPPEIPRQFAADVRHRGVEREAQAGRAGPRRRSPRRRRPSRSKRLSRQATGGTSGQAPARSSDRPSAARRARRGRASRASMPGRVSRPKRRDDQAQDGAGVVLRVIDASPSLGERRNDQRRDARARAQADRPAAARRGPRRRRTHRR